MEDKLTFYHNAAARKILTQQGLRKMQSFVLGKEGEDYIQRLVDEFGDHSWQIFRNVWLKEQSAFEVDFLILTGDAIYSLEAKHYRGPVHISNEEFSLADHKKATNPIYQIRRSRQSLANLLEKERIHAEVRPALIFTGEHCLVHAHDTGDVPVISRAGIRDFIYDIPKSHPLPQQKRAFEQLIQKYGCPNPYPIDEDELDWGQLRRGVRCAGCHSFHVMTNKHTLICLNCDFREPKRLSLYRTCREWASLYCRSTVTAKEIAAFSGGVLSQNYISRRFRQDLDLVPGRKYGLFEFIV